MPAVIVSLASAVVSELNSASFSQPFTAVRYYQPIFDLAEMSALRVSVVPRSVTSKDASRSLNAYDYEIDVAVQKKLTSASLAEIDPLVLLLEEVAKHFQGNKLAEYPTAKCVGVKTEPIYSIEHLDELRQFTGVVTLTFRVWE